MKAKRADTHARLVEVLSHLIKTLRTRLPSEVPGLGKVTADQLPILAELAGSGPSSMGELAAARGIALNSTTALVDRLVAAGLVERAHDDADRRVVRVTATDLGLELYTRLRDVRRAAFRAMLDELDDSDINALVAAIPALERLSGAARVG
jgi:DNA-binding MarR family transcriptional regulator